jgi:hypothetical protein
MKRIIIAIESDLHGGNKLGLMRPGIVLEDLQQAGETRNWQPEATASQHALWELRQENIGKLMALVGDGELHYAQCGDGTQGNKHPAELVSTRLSDQITIAVDNAEPMLALPGLKSAVFVVGTGAHNFAQGSADVLVTGQLKAAHPQIPIHLNYHALVDYSGYTVDYAHHGAYPGSREWLRGNSVRYYLQSLMMHQIRHGRKPPDLVVRGHYHAPVIETVRLGGYTSTAVVLPSMCMIDDFAHQAARSPDDVTCGMMVAEIVDGRLVEMHQLTRTYDTRTEIRL